MINNRQNGRRRGRGGGQRQGGGGQGQRDSGNRIDSRARGNAAQLLEKYKNMARDAQLAGDRVNTEYYLQFADHYFRVLADQRGRSDDQHQPRRQRDDFDQFDDGDDFGDEGDPIRAEEQVRASEQDGNRRDRPYGNARDGDRQRADGRDDRRNGYAADGDDRRSGRAAEMTDERRQPVSAPANDLDETPAAVTADEEGAPRRRRGRKPREEAAAPAASEAASMEADRLPPALGVTGREGELALEGEDTPKPRRRRVRTAAAEVRSAE